MIQKNQGFRPHKHLKFDPAPVTSYYFQCTLGMLIINWKGRRKEGKKERSTGLSNYLPLFPDYSDIIRRDRKIKDSYDKLLYRGIPRRRVPVGHHGHVGHLLTEHRALTSAVTPIVSSDRRCCRARTPRSYNLESACAHLSSSY